MFVCEEMDDELVIERKSCVPPGQVVTSMDLLQLNSKSEMCASVGVPSNN